MSIRSNRKFTHALFHARQKYLARFDAEKAKMQRHYCDVFELWRGCGFRLCRRGRSCRGDAGACLRKALARVPRQQQWDERQRVLERTPPNIGGPERAARGCMPSDFYVP